MLIVYYALIDGSKLGSLIPGGPQRGPLCCCFLFISCACCSHFFSFEWILSWQKKKGLLCCKDVLGRMVTDGGSHFWCRCSIRRMQLWRIQGSLRLDRLYDGEFVVATRAKGVQYSHLIIGVHELQSFVRAIESYFLAMCGKIQTCRLMFKVARNWKNSSQGGDYWWLSYISG